MTALPGLADARAIARQTAADVLRPRERLPVDVWCETHRMAAATGAAGARRGRYSLDETPYLRAMFRSMTDPRVRELTAKKSSQVGWSELVIGAALYTNGELREPGLLIYPTRDEAADFNAKRLIPAMHACGPTAGLVANARDVTQTEIVLGGVPLWFAWAHSVKTVKSDPVKKIFADEIDEWPAGGQVLSNARDRQRTFDDSILIKGSTPEDDEAEGFVSWEYNNAAHRYRFMVPCPITGRFFELYHFRDLRWHGGKDADPDAAARHCWLQSPCVPVPKHKIGDTTEGRIDDRHKRWMVRHGVWVRQGEEIEVTDEWVDYVRPGERDPDSDTDEPAPPIVASCDDQESRGPAGLGGGVKDSPVPDLSRVDGDFLREPARGGRHSRLLAAQEPNAITRRAMGLVRIVGGEDGVAGRIPSASHVAYRINTLASLIDTDGWGGIVRKGIREKFGPDWQKGTLGQAPSIKGDIADVRHLRERCTPVDEGGYKRGTVPDGIGLVTAGVDVQKDCVYALAIGFGAPETDPAIIDPVRIERDERKELTDIDDHLARWRFAIGDTTIRPVFIGVDCGFWMGHVHALVERLRARGVHAWNARGNSGRQARALFDPKRVPEKDEHGNETGRTHETLYFHTDLWMNQLYGLLSDGPGSEEHTSIETMLGEPRRMRMPAPYTFDDGRVSGSTADLLSQITAERRITAYSGNIPVQRWVLKREGMDNHLGDAARIAMAGAQFRGADMLDADAIERLREKATRGHSASTQAPKPEQVTAPRPARPRRAPAHSPGSIVSRWYGN